jgi:uncharacterized SAM-binding protein YcdF (DUF218 family)
MKSKLVKMLVLLFLIMISSFIFRASIFRVVANYLIVETNYNSIEYAFVLSGGAFDRGNKGAALYHEGKVKHFVCTGANQSPDIMALGIDTLESDLTKLQLVKMGVPEAAITLIKEGTSTLEEAEIILSFCKAQGLDSILLISAKFHTRRVYQVFTKQQFTEAGIYVCFQGAPSSLYDEMNWWKSEYGLIALNNEYLKQLYYLVNY